MAEVVDVLLRARMEASGVETGVNQIKNSLKGLTLPKGITDDLEKSFSKLTPLLKDYQKQLNKGFSNKRDLQNFNALKEKIDEVFADIKTQVQRANSEQIRLKVDTQEIDKLEKQLASKSAELQKALNSIFEGKTSTENITSGLDKVLSKSARATTIKPMVNMAKTLFQDQDFSAYNQKIDEMRNKILSLSSTKLDLARALNFKGASDNIEEINKRVNKFFDSLKVNSGKVETVERLKRELKDIGVNLDNVKMDSLTRGATELQGLEGTLDGLVSGFKQTGAAATEAGNGMVRMSEEVNQLKTSTQYFFSLRNMINLLKRGIQEAVQTVKELDAAMTETAVVTKYSVADMWSFLPEYTEMANKLGATIKGAYETTTLYYQQGLGKEAAFGIGEETIKMARIAGLDYAETTDMMTAALRGFNMELNNLSAQHINDVYSELAAKTASNTQEIGSAMERTASIAHSAGMSFEGTSAFLAQMIETTREAPENLGTAMKTIIARFQELKKDPMDMEEVDGELPDYNKVDTALKSIGVSLKNQRGEFRALDDVFLDIAKRWDSLDQRQQRYVATTAAGSRQQSRFIAMMNNYERTAELMEYANNSAGASQEQFNKTLDSFEAKANKLKNAWDRFLMGITDNQIIKGGLDILTNLVEGINDLIETVSRGFGPLKSFLSLFTAFIGLKLGGGLVNRLIGGLGGLLDPRSSFRKGFGVGATGFSSAQASQITNPIISVLEQIRSEVSGIKAKTNIDEGEKITPQQSLQNYKDANKKFRALNSSNTLDDVVDTLKLTNEEQSQLILNNSPGVRSRIKRTFKNIMSNDVFNKQMQESGSVMVDELFEGMQKGTISTKDGLAIYKDLPKAAKIIGSDSAKSFTKDFYKNLYADNKNVLRDRAKSALSMTGASDDVWREFVKNNQQTVLEEMQKAKTSLINEKYGNAFGMTQLPDPSRYEKVAQGVSAIGSGFIAAGQAASTFGMVLNSIGLEDAGAAFMSFGNILTSVGMTIANLVPIIQQYGSKIVGVLSGAIANPAFWAAAIPAGIIAGTVIVNKVIEKKAKEAAEKVTKTYQDAMEDTSKKISTLETNRDILNNLSDGVDRFGNNVSLTNEEYEQFLAASKEVAEVSPSLIKGYTAQGDALVVTGQALDDVIAKEKEYQELARANYVTSSSLQSLAEGVEVSDTYKNYKNSGFFNVNSPNYTGDIEFTNFGYLSDEVENLSKTFSDFDLDGEDIIKQVTGFNVDLNNITQESALIIAKYSDEIQNMTLEPLREKLLTGEIDQEYYDKVKSQLQDSMSAFTTGWNDLLTEAQPLTDAISQYLTSQNLDAAGLQLSEEFVTGFNEGLNLVSLDAISKDLSGAEIQEAARNYANSFKGLVGEGSKYAQIMEQVNEAQDEFADYYDDENAVNKYNDSVKDSVSALRDMADQMDTSTEAGRQLQVMFNDQANTIENWATDVHFTLSETLNTLSDEFAKAKGAKEEFDKAIENGDYYTATEGFKSIYETTTSDENMQGYGSQTFWIGAESLLGENYISTHNLDEIKNRLTEIEPLLQDGAEGFNAFYDEIEAHRSQLKKEGFITVDDATGEFALDIDNSSESLDRFAEILGVSEDLLAGLIDKSRQFVPIDTADIDATRVALSEDERVMQGGSTNEKGKQTLYVSDAVIETEARANGIYGENYTKLIEDLSAENVKVLKTEDLKDGIDVTNGLLKDIGLDGSHSLDDAVKVFSKMGFTLDDTKAILSKNKEGLEISGTEEEIEKAWNENAYSIENPTVAEINTATSGILDNTTAMLTAMGIITDSMQQQVEEVTSDDYVKGIQNNLLDSNGKLKTFSSYEEYSSAKGIVEKQISDYDAMIANLEQGKNAATDSNVQNQIQEQINKLIEARDLLQNSVTESENKWNEHTAEVTERYKNNNFNYDTLAGNNQVDQNYLNTHAIEISSILDSGLDQGVAKLQELREQGVLSEQTIQNLGLALIDVNNTSFSHLNAEQQKVLLDALQLVRTGEQIKTTFSTPFTFEVYDNVNELRDHLNAIGFSGEGATQYRSIIFNTELTNEEKVESFIDQINTDFGDGDQTKTVIIEAAAQFAAGNEPAAMDLLTKQFGAEKAKEIEQKLNVICDGSIVNADEFQTAIEDQAKELISNGFVVDTSVIADIGNITSDPIDLTVGVNTTEGFNKIEELKGHIQAETILAPLDADTTKYDATIEDARDIPDTTLDVYAEAKGNWYKEFTIYKKVIGGGSLVDGQLNDLPSHSSISLRSFAKGYNGPGRKGSKITALTGEMGYEVAWIPSEQRSTILGIGGPEIATFPADTVIYNHEQSKKILKGNRNKIDLGSFAGKGNRAVSSTFKKWVTDKTASKPSGGGSNSSSKSSSSGSSKGSNSSKSDSKEEKHITINNFSIEEVIRFDAEKKIENYQHLVDNWMKDLDKALGKIGTRVSSVSSNLANQIDYLKSIKNQNNNLVDSYKRSLNQLAGGPYNTTISYNSGGESQQEDINLANYIYKDRWDNYQIDKSKIAGAGSKERQEAIFKAAESALNPLVSGLQKAQDAARAAQDAIDDLEKKIYDNFYGWENELTEIYHLTQRLENDSSLLDRFTSQVNLEIARLSAGFNTVTSAVQNSTAAMSRHTKTLNDQVKAQHQMITARQKELDAALTTQDELDKYLQIAKRHGADSGVAKQAEEEWKAANMAAGYVSNVVRQEDGSVTYDIDWAKFNKDQAANPINKETYEKIKAQLDNLNATSKAFNESIKDTTDLLDSIYDQLAEYQKTIADFEKTILDQLEKSIQEEIDNSKKLNDAIKTGFKDLLDQVRRKLDERRQKEDNAKTEQDIANKQQRLSLLRSSTNGSQVEIAQLEKEIGDAQQSYQRTLEDQLLARLQQQEDLAAKQREQQIALAQASLDVQRSSNAELVNMWLKDPVRYQEQLEAAWMKAQDYEGKGFHEQQLLRQEFTAQFTQLQTALFNTGELLNGSENLTLKQLEASGANLTTLVSLVQTLEAEITKKNIAKNPTTKNTTDKATKTSIKTTSKPAPAKSPAPKPAAKPKSTTKNLTNADIKGIASAIWIYGSSKSGWGTGQTRIKNIDKIFGSGAGQKVQNFINVHSKTDSGWTSWDTAKKYFKSKYKKGGLAPFTGPAWLDGTQSKPELVLNATDTKNFIQLKDILASTMRAGAFNTPVAVSGDTNYEININVDHINNDYDVDKIANRVKKIIVQDSSYRNVTSVRKFR